MHKLRFATLLTLVMLTSLAGCQRGPALGTVTGTVRVNGKPLPFAYVVFQPIDPPGAYGSAYADELGEYELQFSRARNGAPVGKHRVSIRAPRGEEVDSDEVQLSHVEIPAKFNSATELEREVEPGENVHDFDLDVPITVTSTR